MGPLIAQNLADMQVYMGPELAVSQVYGSFVTGAT